MITLKIVWVLILVSWADPTWVEVQVHSSELECHQRRATALLSASFKPAMNYSAECVKHEIIEGRRTGISNKWKTHRHPKRNGDE